MATIHPNSAPTDYSPVEILAQTASFDFLNDARNPASNVIFLNFYKKLFILMTELEYETTNSKDTLTLNKLNKTHLWDKLGPWTKNVRPQIREVN